jgi:hypothetical protein
MTAALGRQQSQHLAGEHRIEKSHPGDVGAGAIEACYESFLDRIAAKREHDRDRCGRCFGGQNYVDASGRNDCSHLAADQIGRKCRQSLALVFREPVFDCDIATIHKPPSMQPSAKRFYPI